MDDAAPAPAVQQQQHDSASASGAQAAAPPTWGTLEELLLVGAITRHGAGDWAIIATELQSRGKLLTMPAAYFSPEACKGRFDALNGKYGHSFRGGGSVAAAGDGRDKEPENHWPWFEEIRKRRVAQLRRELERHDGSISILTQKLKRLKTERGPKQLPETFKPPLQPAEDTTSSEKDAVVVPPSSAGEAPAPVVVEQSQGGSPVDAPAGGDTDGALQSIKDNYVVAADNAADGDERQQGLAVEKAGTSQEEAVGPKMEVSKSDLSGGEAAKDESQAEAAQATDMEVDDCAALPTAQAVEPTEAGAEADDEMKVTEGPSEDQAPDRPADDAVGKETESSSCSLKMLAEDDRLVVAISAEAIMRTEANTAGSPEDRSEKEASSNGSSQEASKPVEEKSDESQVAAARSVENLEPPEKAVDAGSPSSAEGPQEQSKDGASQIEKSEVGSQVEGLGEDSSPTSRSLKKGDPKLADWLKTLYNHKFGPMFKQRQESQDDSRYDQLIKRHIDLNMIRSRLEAGGYSSSMEFFRDLLLLFSNATVFYPRESQEHNAAALLRKLTMEEMDRMLRAEDAGPTTKPTTTRKRPTTTNKATTMPGAPAPVPAAPAAALTPATAQAVPTTSRTTTQGGDVSVSENSKSKSASVSLGVRSSKGGDEGEGGEPEVSGKSKPLKAYVRKNRAERGKAVKESPLETIVQKEAAMVAAKDSKAAAASKGKNAAKEKEKLTKEKSEKSGSKGSKGPAASAAASAPPAAASAAAPAVAPVRGARNKRSKESSQRGGGNAGKRSRRT